jgi:hypothetical protein
LASQPQPFSQPQAFSQQAGLAQQPQAFSQQAGRSQQRRTMWQHFFSQPQAFSQQAGLQQAGAGAQQAGLQQAGAGAQQAGAGAQQAGLQQAGSGAQQAFTGPQASQAQQCLQAHRSLRPQNRSRTGVTRWQQVFSQPQAFSQQAGFAQHAGSGAQHSPLKPWLQRATLNSSVPNIILVLIEQQLLYNELRMLSFPLATSNAEISVSGRNPSHTAGSPMGQNRLRRVCWSQFSGKAGKLQQFARLRRQRPSSHSMTRNFPHSVSGAPSQRATAARAIR